MSKLKSSAQNINLLNPLIGTIGILMIPLVAMQVTSEVNWDETDFLVMGVLLFITGLIIEAVRVKVRDANNKLLLGAIIVGLFLLVWAELAVGIFGSPFAGS